MEFQSYCSECTKEEFELFEPAIEHLISLANSEILPRFLSGTRVFDKKDHTPVTEADKGAERIMREWIEKEFPEHGIFGEEYGMSIESVVDEGTTVTVKIPAQYGKNYNEAE